MTDQTETQAMSKKKIITFLALAFILATLSYITIFLNDNPTDSPAFVALQWSPAIAAFITLLIYQRNLRGLGWGWGGWGGTKYQILSIVLPFIIPLAVFVTVWVLGFGEFSNTEYVETVRNDSGVTLESDTLIMLMALTVNFLLGWAVGGIFALGEEIGWRGFLLPELAKNMSYTQASLISGIIWAAFHYPFFIFIVAPELDIPWWFMIPVATISAIGISFILAWLRLKSNSLWTAVIFHAYLNIHIQGFFENLTVSNNSTKYMSGEQGILMAIAFTVVAYLFWRKRSELPAQVALVK